MLVDAGRLKKRKTDTIAIIFFFSSRRRHTRWNCDWSSDVCSSDLALRHQLTPAPATVVIPPAVVPAQAGIHRRARSWTLACAHERRRELFGDRDTGRRSEERRVGKECRCWWTPED